MPPFGRRRGSPSLTVTRDTGFKYVLEPDWATPEYESLKTITLLGAKVANAIANDNGEIGILSEDGPDTFDQLRPLLMALNQFRGMATYGSQALRDGLQRPFVDIIAHRSLLPLFISLSTEDNILVLANGVPIPLTTEIIQPDTDIEWLRNNASRKTYQKKDDDYLISYTNDPIVQVFPARLLPDMLTFVVHSIVDHSPEDEEEMDVFDNDMIDEACKHLFLVSVVWTKRSDLEGFVSTIKKYLDGKVDFRRKSLGKIVAEREREQN